MITQNAWTVQLDLGLIVKILAYSVNKIVNNVTKTVHSAQTVLLDMVATVKNSVKVVLTQIVRIVHKTHTYAMNAKRISWWRMEHVNPVRFVAANNVEMIIKLVFLVSPDTELIRVIFTVKNV